jgi:DNA polymerase I
MTTTALPATTSSSTALSEIAELRELAGQVFCLDLETAMAPVCFGGRDHVRLLQVGNDAGVGYIDLQTLDDDGWDCLQDWLEDPGLVIVGHNISFDYRCLLGCGIQLRGKLEDTMKMSQIIWNGMPEVRHGLEPVAKRVLGVKVDKGHQTDDWMRAELSDSQIAYALGDVTHTWQVWQALQGQILQEGLGPTYRLECALIPVTVEMEHTGLPLDRVQLDEVLVEYGNRIPPARAELLELIDGHLTEAGHEGLPRDADGSFNTRPKATGYVRDGSKRPAGFNMGSPAQMLRVLNQLDIEPVDRKTQKPTTDKKVLRRFAGHPVVAGYLGLRADEKRCQMVEGLKEKADWSVGRVFARLDPLNTGTGRFSSSNPNLQNLPREAFVRDIVAVPPGFDLIQLDVSAMEMAVAASASIANEVKLQHALNEGLDVHTRTASLMFSCAEEEITKTQRQQAKAVNFGALYGSGAGGLMDYFASMGMFIAYDEANDLRNRWMAAYPAFPLWHRRCEEELQRTGAVRMVDGRRRWLNGDMARPTVVANNKVQGTSASIIKRAMRLIWNWKETHQPAAKVILQVHDELLLQVPEGTGEPLARFAEGAITQAGLEIIGDSVTLRAEAHIGKAWGQCK